MNIKPTKQFDNELKKFLKKNPQYRKKITKSLQTLSEDSKYPSLRLHKVGEDEYSISVDMRIRIIISFRDDNILLLTIGNHDEVYN